ncbi:MAG: AAA family ATPase, partial [Nitrospinota bacterium]
ENLVNTFKLDAIETRILLFVYLVEKMDDLEPLFSEHSIDNFSSKMVFVNHGHKIIGCSKREVIQTLKRGKLHACGLLKKGHSALEVKEWVSDFFLEINSPDIASEFCSLYKGKTLPLKDHVWEKAEQDILLEFLSARKRGMNFLFYGEPGTGKTELAKSLALETKKDLYIIKNRENEGVDDLKTAIIASTNVLDPDKTVLLVDEADGLLNSRDAYLFSGEQNSKSWLNSFLDSTKHKIIWITNNSDRMESSVLRRFAFSRHFKMLSFTQKNRIFKTCLRQNNLENFLSDKEIRELSKKFRINAGGISDVLKNLKLRKNSNKERALKKIELILGSHERALTGENVKKRKMKKLGNYSPSLLNTSESPERIIRALTNFGSTKGGRARIVPQNLNLLFYGLPGTGKSEFAKFIAESLERELVLKRASDLLNCWLGQTEKQIALAFEEAEDEKALLFIDEADSFFIKRSEARHSWERSQTNELLTQMENFRGILICATNFKEGLDRAALRRFKFKIEFKPLLPKGLLQIYDLLLAPLAIGKLSSPEKQLLSSLNNLTPGDFHVVSEKITLS